VHFSESAPQITPGTGIKTTAQRKIFFVALCNLAFWKLINEDDAVLIPKNRGKKFSSGFLHSEFFWGGMSRYAATPLIVALSPGHSDITRLRPWSIATRNHLDRAEKIPKVAQTTDTIDVFDPHSGISGPTVWVNSAHPSVFYPILHYSFSNLLLKIKSVKVCLAWTATLGPLLPSTSISVTALKTSCESSSYSKHSELQDLVLK
jgi:hypothetical protein